MKTNPKNFKLENSVQKTSPSLGLFSFEKSQARIINLQISQSMLGNFLVPTLDLALEQSDYVQILRCQESFRAILDGMIQNIKAMSRDDRQWVWADLFGNSQWCKIVSLNQRGIVIQDIAAPNGEFFYILNPCVSEGFSENKQSGCSFNLTASLPTSFHEPISDGLLIKLSQLKALESRYDALLARLDGLTRELEIKKDLCLKNSVVERQAILETESEIDIATIVAAGVLSLGVGGFLRLKKLPNSVPKVLKQNPFLLPSTIILGAGAISIAIRKAMNENELIDKITCLDADRLAQEILGFNKGLDPIKNAMMAKSQEIKNLYMQFEGYDEALFTQP